jgi:hypothetical protein
MNTTGFRLQHGLAVLTFLLAPTLSPAMSGMDMPTGGPAKTTPSLSKSIGEPINSSEPEIEITYSADGKTAVFVSGRQGSVPSPGVPYNFDIWIAHNVNGTWQAPIHLGPGIDPTVGPNINTSAWEWMGCGNRLETGMMCRNFHTSIRPQAKSIVPSLLLIA